MQSDAQFPGIVVALLVFLFLVVDVLSCLFLSNAAVVNVDEVLYILSTSCLFLFLWIRMRRCVGACWTWILDPAAVTDFPICGGVPDGEEGLCSVNMVAVRSLYYRNHYPYLRRLIIKHIQQSYVLHQRRIESNRNESNRIESNQIKSNRIIQRQQHQRNLLPSILRCYVILYRLQSEASSPRSSMAGTYRDHAREYEGYNAATSPAIV